MPSTKRRAGSSDDSPRKRFNKGRPSMEPSVVIPRHEHTVDASSDPVMAAPAPAGQGSEHMKALSLLQGDLESMRHSLTCKICEKLFYEPFVLSCGHTYCYRCLSTWFTSARKPTCPNCRVRIVQMPAPSYVVKELVSVIVSRTELLADGETLEEHEVWRQQETDFCIAERQKDGGLFEGLFKEKRRQVVDALDGVMRCPYCTWELEDGRCERCQLEFDSQGDELSAGSWSPGLRPDEPPDFDEMDDLDMDLDDEDGDWSADDDDDRAARGRHMARHFNMHEAAHRAGMAASSIFSAIRRASPFGRSRAVQPHDMYDEEGDEEEEYDEEDDDDGSMRDFVVDDTIDPGHSPISITSGASSEPSDPDEDIRVVRQAAPSWRRGRTNRITISDTDDNEDEDDADQSSDTNTDSSSEADESGSESDSDSSGSASASGDGNSRSSSAAASHASTSNPATSQHLSTNDDDDEDDESDDEDDEPPRSSGRRRVVTHRGRNYSYEATCTCPDAHGEE